MIHLHNLAILAALVLPAAALLRAQQADPRVYGGFGSGVWIALPSGHGVRVVVDPPVMPGGPGTVPGSHGEDNGWNHSTGALFHSNSTTSISLASSTFAKLQTVTVRVDPAPNEKHWEAQGSAKVGGVVKARLIHAIGTCHAAASSKTAVIYGGESPTAKDQEAVALAEAGNASIGAQLQIAGFGAGFSTTYAVAGSSESIRALADPKTGRMDRSNSAIIDYTQKGDMAGSVRAGTTGTVATVDLTAKAKGSATISFFLVNGP